MAEIQTLLDTGQLKLATTVISQVSLGLSLSLATFELLVPDAQPGNLYLIKDDTRCYLVFKDLDGVVWSERLTKVL